MDHDLALIGYSGHSYVAIDIAKSNGISVKAYCDLEEKMQNPFELRYLGNENDESVIATLRRYDLFVSIGDNLLRNKVTQGLDKNSLQSINLIHSSAIVSSYASLGRGVMIGPNSCLNGRSQVGNGTICNTGSIIEHDCKVGNFAHIAPGAVLSGNVKVGDLTLIGSNAVIKQGIKIGTNVVIGAGAVVIEDIKDNCKAVGNPARLI